MSTWWKVLNPCGNAQGWKNKYSFKKNTPTERCISMSNALAVQHCETPKKRQQLTRMKMNTVDAVDYSFYQHQLAFVPKCRCKDIFNCLFTDDWDAGMHVTRNFSPTLIWITQQRLMVCSLWEAENVQYIHKHMVVDKPNKLWKFGLKSVEGSSPKGRVVTKTYLNMI